MGANDNYQFGRTQPLGKVSFGDGTYSDQFVRAETANLQPPKKKTTPLNVTAELVEQMVASAENQLRTCRIIVDKFNQRMRILQWAEEVARTTNGSAPPEPEPEAQPEPEPTPKKKGLFGKKLGAPKAAPKLGSKAAGKAGLRGGPSEAKSASSKPPKVKTTVQLSGPEQTLGMSIAKIISRDPHLHRRVQVAIYQYSEALRAVNEGQASLDGARANAPQKAFDELEKLEVAKIQGKIYPLCNFHEVFKDKPEVARLFPPPMPRK